jgi:hypothetical protein
MNTHTVLYSSQVWLRQELSGGVRGILNKGTQVSVVAENKEYDTSYILAPLKGWVSSYSLKKISTTPDPGAEIESIVSATVTAKMTDGSTKVFQLK